MVCGSSISSMTFPTVLIMLNDIRRQTAGRYGCQFGRGVSGATSLADQRPDEDARVGRTDAGAEYANQEGARLLELGELEVGEALVRAERLVVTGPECHGLNYRRAT